MEKRVKVGMTPTGIVALVFSIMGFLFLLFGVLCQFFPEDEDDKIVGIVFSIIGLVFLVSALILLVVLIAGQCKKQKVFSNGKYLWGEIVDIVPNYYMSYGWRPAYTVLTRYIDGNGTIHIFRSSNLKSYPDRSLLGRKVKIYYQDESFKQYYVDLESGFPRIMEH